MVFSTKTTYGLRAMVYLAKKGKNKPVSLSKIAEIENISLKYLERIFNILKNKNLVKPVMGAAGGYKLKSPAKTITVFEIINALEGRSWAFHCFGAKGKKICGQKCSCDSTSLLLKITTEVEKALKKIKLSEL